MTDLERIRDLWTQRNALYRDLRSVTEDEAAEIADNIITIEERMLAMRAKDADDFFAKLQWLKELTEAPNENGHIIRGLVLSLELDCTLCGASL